MASQHSQRTPPSDNPSSDSPSWVVVVFLIAVCVSSATGLATEPIWVADGLTIHKIADDDIIPDCTAITVDPDGRIVASGRGYIRSLSLAAAGKVASKPNTLVSGLRHGAHGMCFHERDLYYTADNGIWKVVDTDSDGVVDSTPTQMLNIKTGGEHDAHALRVGPDGFWYLICGNGTKGMFELQNTPSPAISNPRAGAIWRISPDWSQRSVWAHGFRNAYDFDFAPDNQIDTFDSDGERDISLPWYRPTRVYRASQSDDAGWVSRSWKRPNSDPQMPDVLSELGRGSPTGVMRYRNKRLPKRFHNGVFVLDWTFGRIAFVGDDKQTEIIAKPTGTAGFAVTDIAELPDGRIVVSVGGRRSRGGLYLIDASSPGPSEHQIVEWADGQDQRRPGVHSQHLLQRIIALRQRPTAEINRRDFATAIESLEVASSDAAVFNAIALMIEAAGGVGPVSKIDARGKQQLASVFDGYRGVIQPEIPERVRRRAGEALLTILKESDSTDVQREAIRTLAVLESLVGWQGVVDYMDRAQSPIDKLHGLIALARLTYSSDDATTSELIRWMLEIPVLVDETNGSIDRNWAVRLGELFVAVRHRDTLLPTRLVTHPDFGHPAHLVWTARMNPEGLEIARRRFLREGDHWTEPKVANFIAQGDDAVPRRFIREWLSEPRTREAGWLALASHPQPSDEDELSKAALSLNKAVREAAERALRSLGLELPERTTDSQSIKRWVEKAPLIAAMKGDAAKGKQLFTTRQCANCHNGGKALGPSLSGISKRFGAEDLFRATVDPNHTIPDRYQAQQVLTTEGAVLVGMKVYQSVDGITLLTAEGETLRINADSIQQIQPSSKSLMPEGLLDTLDDQSVADLVTYLRSL